MDDIGFVSVEEAAKILFVARPHIRALIADGKLSAASDGRLFLPEVLAYKERQQIEAKQWLKRHAADFGEGEP